jgi:hypothetical protein
MRRITMTVLGLTVFAAPLLGQSSALREVRHDQGGIGINLVVADPLGAFRRHGNVAAGVSIGAVRGVRGSGLGLRVEAAWMVYAADYRDYGVSTTSQLATLAVGPQFTLGQGPVRPYAFALAGGSVFWSSAHYGDGCGCYDRDYYLDGDVTTTTSAGTGLLIRVKSGDKPIAIDLGFRGVRHDFVKYVPANGITQNPDGTFSAQRVESRVEMRVYHLGVTLVTW